MRKMTFAALALCNLLTLVTTHAVWAQNPAIKPPFTTQLGFKRLSDPATPDFLKKAARSVFEIRTLSAESPNDLTQLDLTDPKLKNVEAKIDANQDWDDKEKLIIKKQIQACRRNGSEKECVVFFTIEKSTGFLAGYDGSMLWTNAHVVERFLKLRATLAKRSVPQQLKAEPRVAIFLFDLNGHLVFDSFDNVANVVVYTDEISRVAQARGDWYAEDSDFVGIKLDHPIGLPLKIGAKATFGQNLYRPGFPGCTGCASNPNQVNPMLNQPRGQGKDSSGQGPYWTSGETPSNERLMSFIGIPGIENYFKMDQMVFFSADSQVGFSGGPILNESGEAVGVFSGSLPRKYGNEMVVLSRGVRPPAFNP